MTGRSLACACVAVLFAIALLWWGAWAFHALRGWTAMPLGLTVGCALYAGMICFGFASLGARRK